MSRGRVRHSSEGTGLRVCVKPPASPGILGVIVAFLCVPPGGGRRMPGVVWGWCPLETTAWIHPALWCQV